MYVIGMTGGVGSGKTQAACLLKEIASAELLIADELGHVAMEKGTDGYDEIIESFGTDILDADGQISRTVMAEKVFHDKERLALLNGIIHPKVKAYIRQYIDDRKDQEGVLILENAILFETGCDAFCDEIWYIAVSADTRKKRLHQNRGYSDEKSRAIMERQQSDAFFYQRCDKAIDNNGSLEQLKQNLIKEYELIQRGRKHAGA